MNGFSDPKSFREPPDLIFPPFGQHVQFHDIPTCHETTGGAIPKDARH